MIFMLITGLPSFDSRAEKNVSSGFQVNVTLVAARSFVSRSSPIPTKLVGFNATQTRTLTSDFAEAARLCMVAVNSLIINAQMQINHRPQDLLKLAFHISASDANLDDEVQTIKNTFISIPGRATVVTVSHDTSHPTGATNTIEFVAFTKDSSPNFVFVRGAYFSRAQRDALSR